MRHEDVHELRPLATKNAYWPTLPFFPGKSRKINTPPGVQGISSKLPEKPKFCLIQDFPENSMVSPRMSRFFELFSKVCTVLIRTSNCAQHFEDLTMLDLH